MLNILHNERSDNYLKVYILLNRLIIYIRFYHFNFKFNIELFSKNHCYFQIKLIVLFNS